MAHPLAQVVHPDWDVTSECYKLADARTAMESINARLDEGTDRMVRIESTIAENHKSANHARERLETKIDASVGSSAEILEIVQALKGFAKVVGALGRVVGWAAAIIAPLVAIWYSLPGAKK